MMPESLWRMASGVDPQRPHIDDLLAVHPKRVDCRFANFGQSNNDRSADGPVKMIEPTVLLRMKKPRLDTDVGCSMCAKRLVPVARWASQTEIAKLRRSAFRYRQDVLDFKNHNR